MKQLCSCSCRAGEQCPQHLYQTGLCLQLSTCPASQNIYKLYVQLLNGQVAAGHKETHRLQRGSSSLSSSTQAPCLICMCLHNRFSLDTVMCAEPAAASKHALHQCKLHALVLHHKWLCMTEIPIMSTQSTNSSCSWEPMYYACSRAEPSKSPAHNCPAAVFNLM